MKSYILSFFVASLACHAEATEFGDISLFLPFLNYEPPPACPPNEMYMICTGKCADCTQRGMCIVTECIKGCDCAPHFYRLTEDGPCEPVANCPRPECDENEVFRECGPVCERCTTMKCRAINCDHKCYCKEGYLRNDKGICVPDTECPIRRQCSNTEEWAEVGPVNEFCLSEESERVNETQNVAQCYCKEGYKRNVIGYCIKENFCQFIRCPGVEVFHECVPRCNTTCRNYGNPNCTEDDNCYPGCFCPPGYVMNDFRTCIPVDTCSLDSPRVKIVESSFIIAVDESSDSENATDSSAVGNTDTTDTTEYPGGDETVGRDYTDSGEIATDTEDSQDDSPVQITESPVPSSRANIKPPKKRNGKMRNSEGRSSKHANAAASSKQASKQETSKSEEDFDNEEI